MRVNKNSSSPLALLGVAVALGLPGVTVAQGVCQGLAQADCRALAGRVVYALTPSNVIATLYGSKVIATSRVGGVDGRLIGIDFRPSQSSSTSSAPVLYGLSDTGKIYTITLDVGSSSATLVSTLGASFDGGVQSLADFNPVVDALRVIGSNDQNFAVVNSNGGNLNQTVPQSLMTYAVGDVAAGLDPNLTAGAYNNNIPGANATIFYALDYARDTMVTIADLTATGSSNTGGGKLKTLGKLVDPQGKPINISPMAGIDIYTDPAIGNAAIISNGVPLDSVYSTTPSLYYINLATVNTSRPLGTTQNVVAIPLTGGANSSSFLIDPNPQTYVDVAATPVARIAAPADLSIEVTAIAATQGTMLDPSFFGWDKGKPMTFTVKVTNLGPDTSNGVIMTASVFPFNDPVTSSTQGSCSVTPYALPQYGKDIRCSIGNLGTGATATITVTVTRPADYYATATELNPSFSTDDRNGQVFATPSSDPNTTNNSQSKKVIVNR